MAPHPHTPLADQLVAIANALRPATRPTKLDRLIRDYEKVRAKCESFEKVIASVPPTEAEELEATYDQRVAALYEAKDAIATYPATTREEVRIKADFLLDHCRRNAELEALLPVILELLVVGHAAPESERHSG